MDQVRNSYPASMSGIIVLLKYQTLDFAYVEVLNVNLCKHHNCILLLTVSNTEFHGQFPYLGKQQDIRFKL